MANLNENYDSDEQNQKTNPTTANHYEGTRFVLMGDFALKDDICADARQFGLLLEEWVFCEQITAQYKVHFLIEIFRWNPGRVE